MQHGNDERTSTHVLLSLLCLVQTVRGCRHQLQRRGAHTHARRVFHSRVSLTYRAGRSMAAAARGRGEARHTHHTQGFTGQARDRHAGRSGHNSAATWV